METQVLTSIFHEDLSLGVSKKSWILLFIRVGKFKFLKPLHQYTLKNSVLENGAMAIQYYRMKHHTSLQYIKYFNRLPDHILHKYRHLNIDLVTLESIIFLKK